MRQPIVAAVSIVAAGLAIVMARRLSRSNIEHKVEELQEKFRGLDTILPTAAEPHL